MNGTQETQIDLRQLGKMLVKRAWLILLCAAVAGTAMLVYTINFVTPTYQTSVVLYVNNSEKRDSGAVSSSDLAVALRLVNTYVEIIRSDAVLDKVAEKLGVNASAAQLRGMISANTVEDTEIFRVTVTSTSPQFAADVANAVADVAPGVISRIINGSKASVIDMARVPTSQSAPNYVNNTMLGVALGAVLAIVAILLHASFDVRVKDAETLQAICGCPVLGTIPDFAEMNKSSGRKVRR